MRNLTTAIFLTFLFCAVSIHGEDWAKGSGKKYQFVQGRSFRDTLWEKRWEDWEKKWDDWEKRLSTASAPKSPSRVTRLKIHKHSSSKSFRSSHKSFRSSHSHKGRHVRRGKSHVRRKSRR